MISGEQFASLGKAAQDALPDLRRILLRGKVMRVRKPVDDLLEEIEDTMLDEDDDACVDSPGVATCY